LEEEETRQSGGATHVASPGKRGRQWHLIEPVLYAVLALVLNLAGNDRTGLWDRDEPRYAVCTREMRERGDWIYPTFNGEPRYHKPVLIYWLMRAGTALGGDNPFGARLISALAGAATVLGVTVLGRRMLGARGDLRDWSWRQRRLRSPNRSWRPRTRRWPCWFSAVSSASGSWANGPHADWRASSGFV
jgi:hypothetical protein